jgi:hypothetical protein
LPDDWTVPELARRIADNTHGIEGVRLELARALEQLRRDLSTDYVLHRVWEIAQGSNRIDIDAIRRELDTHIEAAERRFDAMDRTLSELEARQVAAVTALVNKANERFRTVVTIAVCNLLLPIVVAVVIYGVTHFGGSGG